MKKYQKYTLQHGPLLPMLDQIKPDFSDTVNFNTFPFSVPLVKNLKGIEFPTHVTFLVGENGSGKSTLLEAIACKAGFGAEGGSKNFNFTTSEEKNYTSAQLLADQLTFSWRMKPKNGYFFRAESFFNVATYIDGIGIDIQKCYGVASLHGQSHGETFLAFFKSRMKDGGFFIFDEPEAALSPQRQLVLLTIIHEMCKITNSQFIIATHSPILLAYPGATIYSCDAESLTPIEYTKTEHYKITKQFLDNPQQFLHYLFNNDAL